MVKLTKMIKSHIIHLELLQLDQTTIIEHSKVEQIVQPIIIMDIVVISRVNLIYQEKEIQYYQIRIKETKEEKI